MATPDFETLLQTCTEFGELFPDGLVYIGGIAVYLHSVNNDETKSLAETTHDADLYISLADIADLRDLEEVTSNRRLSKHQLVKRGFEFDIYTERQSTLIVPYDAVVAHSIAYDGVRIAALEHLLVLKLEAFADRKGSAKGDKDAKDLLRIATVAQRSEQGFRAELAAPYLREQHLPLLAAAERGGQASALALGNAVLAKRLRSDMASVTAALEAASRNDHDLEP